MKFTLNNEDSSFFYLLAINEEDELVGPGAGVGVGPGAGPVPGPGLGIGHGLVPVAHAAGLPVFSDPSGPASGRGGLRHGPGVWTGPSSPRHHDGAFRGFKNTGKMGNSPKSFSVHWFTGFGANGRI